MTNNTKTNRDAVIKQLTRHLGKNGVTLAPSPRDDGWLIAAMPAESSPFHAVKNLTDLAATALAPGVVFYSQSRHAYCQQVRLPADVAADQVFDLLNNTLNQVNAAFLWYVHGKDEDGKYTRAAELISLQEKRKLAKADALINQTTFKPVNWIAGPNTAQAARDLEAKMGVAGNCPTCSRPVKDLGRHTCNGRKARG